MRTLTARNGTAIFMVAVLCLAASFLISTYMLPARASENARLGEEVAVVSLASGDAWSGVGGKGGLRGGASGPWCIYAVITSDGGVLIRYVEFLSPDGDEAIHKYSSLVTSSTTY